MNIPELIEKKKVDIAALRKRIVGIDSMMAQGQEERNDQGAHDRRLLWQMSRSLQ